MYPATARQWCGGHVLCYYALCLAVLLFRLQDLRYQTVRMKRISLRSAILLLLVVKATLCASTSQPAVDWCWQSVYASQDNETLGPSHCPRVMRHLTCKFLFLNLSVVKNPVIFHRRHQSRSALVSRTCTCMWRSQTEEGNMQSGLSFKPNVLK